MTKKSQWIYSYKFKKSDLNLVYELLKEYSLKNSMKLEVECKKNLVLTFSDFQSLIAEIEYRTDVVALKFSIYDLRDFDIIIKIYFDKANLYDRSYISYGFEDKNVFIKFRNDFEELLVKIDRYPIFIRLILNIYILAITVSIVIFTIKFFNSEFNFEKIDSFWIVSWFAYSSAATIWLNIIVKYLYPENENCFAIKKSLRVKIRTVIKYALLIFIIPLFVNLISNIMQSFLFR